MRVKVPALRKCRIEEPQVEGRFRIRVFGLVRKQEGNVAGNFPPADSEVELDVTSDLGIRYASS